VWLALDWLAMAGWPIGFVARLLRWFSGKSCTCERLRAARVKKR
jgi:hypothetical protein